MQINEMLGGLNRRGMDALAGDRPRRLVVNEFGEVIDADTGKPMPLGAGGAGGGPPSHADALAQPGGTAALGFVTPPGSQNFIDKDRERWQGKGYKSVDDALAASLRGEGPGSGGGFAIQGPGGQWFSSNEERDKALASSPNIMDQYQAFKQMAPKLGIFPGAHGGYSQDAFAKFLGMANEGKKGQALMEEGLNRQYQLGTRGPQEDAAKLNAALIEGRSRETAEQMRGQAARDVSERNIRGQLSSDKMKLLAPLVSAGDKAGVEATTRLLGSIERANEASRLGKNTEEVNRQLSDDAAKQASATATTNLMRKLGVMAGKDAKGNESFAPFDADLAIQEVMKDPSLLKNQDFLAALRKGGGRNTPESIRASSEQALLPLVNEPSLTASAMEPSVRDIGGLTFERLGGDSMLPARHRISAGGRKLTEITPRMMPLGEAAAGTRNIIPRFWKSSTQKQAEQEAAINFYKALHGIP